MSQAVLEKVIKNVFQDADTDSSKNMMIIWLPKENEKELKTKVNELFFKTAKTTS